MTEGIHGTGPYSELRDLRWQAKKCKYEIEFMSPGPRTRKLLQQESEAIAQKIKGVNARIKSERVPA